ncbi:N-hydroxyarylamine O-acetyltransferase [Desulfonispora thiosulfatigenes DSM 11270]|uniref:N-hydroxyarylamine O-acetyltransferase n=1 Tax=Desulfonispora thiosulfatigenes DSM 11270 TaxID=656914 RepID=A0A1W1UFK7_DESTI|nr:N-hydroxyarylamine O-acetyltransferase [Desulfonispora thiosulfatigenes DSM 11270]
MIPKNQSAIDINALFRKRIGMQVENITFESLSNILEKTAENIPFENLCIIENRTSNITKESLIEKILVKNEGGLCYELNLILYFFLKENGFDAALIGGVIYNNDIKKYQKLGRTHVVILVTYKEQKYLIDTGFGGNLPLKPVPLTEESVSSKNGEFRVKRVNGEYGDYVFEMRLKHRDTDWKIGYAFDTKKSISDLSEINMIQKIIAEHKDSPFNKSPLITRLTGGGNLILTNNSFTQRTEGVVSKETIDSMKFKELLKQHFGM